MVSFPGYRSIRDAHIYARRHDSKHHEILLLERWREPTREEVIRTIRSTVLRVDEEHRLDRKHIDHYLDAGDHLAAQVITLHPQLIADLRELHPRALRFTGEFTADLPRDPTLAPLHLDCTVGTLRSSRLKSVDAPAYLRAMHANEYENVRYTISMRLQDWTMRPKESMIEELLASERPGGAERGASTDDVVATINTLYSGLRSRGDVLRIPDRTGEALETCADITLRSMRESLRATAIFMEGLRAGMKTVQNDDAETPDAVSPTEDIVN